MTKPVQPDPQGQLPPKAAGSRVVVVQVLGGLGNQLFQTATGHALARKLGARLEFDLSRYRDKGLRAFALAPFGLEARFVAGQSGLGARMRRAFGRVTGLVDPLRPPGFKGRIYREPGFRYDPAFETLEGDVLLSGYFQSPRYFAGYESEIADLFAPDKLASDTARDLARRLEGEDSVAIHLRRGDYVNDPRAMAVHGVLDAAYYDRAVAHIRAKVPQARLFVFSDDPAAAKEAAARWPGAEALAGTSAGDDLYLMSAARHHVVANSSFSWWSAWLDRRPGGLRIAPESWFTPEALLTRPIDDLIPQDWVRL